MGRLSVLIGAAALGVTSAAALALRVRRVRSLAMSGMGSGTAASPRVAATEAQADVLHSAWESDADLAAFTTNGGRHRHEALIYSDDDLVLHGRLAWATGGGLADGARPGVLLVHTAVGPHHLFLHWRAQSLAAQGFVVLIVDCFGDDRGAASHRGGAANFDHSAWKRDS